jgi:hypothetical protein
MSEQQEDLIEATVGKVVIRDKGSYLVAYPKLQVLPSGTPITCSLDNWDDTSLPEKGQKILLADVREFSKGWRATRAQPKKLTR